VPEALSCNDTKMLVGAHSYCLVKRNHVLAQFPGGNETMLCVSTLQAYRNKLAKEIDLQRSVKVYMCQCV